MTLSVIIIQSLFVLIRKISNMPMSRWKCPTCDYLNKAGALTCHYCNTACPKWICNSCGAINHQDDKVCHSCGVISPWFESEKDTLEKHRKATRYDIALGKKIDTEATIPPERVSKVIRNEGREIPFKEDACTKSPSGRHKWYHDRGHIFKCLYCDLARRSEDGK
jgi:hypothetical protein